MVLSGRLAGLHRGMNTIRSLEDLGIGHSFLYVQDEASAPPPCGCGAGMRLHVS